MQYSVPDSNIKITYIIAAVFYGFPTLQFFFNYYQQHELSRWFPLMFCIMCCSILSVLISCGRDVWTGSRQPFKITRCKTKASQQALLKTCCCSFTLNIMPYFSNLTDVFRHSHSCEKTTNLK